MAFYNSTNGPGWRYSTGWLQTNTPCNWASVWCSGGSVVDMAFYDLRGDGPLPAEFGNLSNLEHFECELCGLTGSIPAELGNLSHLRLLWLMDNELTGSIPAELGNLSSLQSLYLYDNQLTGAIPAELGNLTGLTYLHLNDNHLSGLLPLSVAAVGGSLLASWQCFFTPGNSGLYMPDVPAYRAADADNDGLICGLPFTADVSTVAGDIGAILDDLLAAGVVNDGQANALTRKVDQALELLARGRKAEAIVVLQNFNRQVNELTDVVFTRAQADELIARAEIMIQLV